MLTPRMGSISFMECVGNSGHIWLIPPVTSLFYGEVAEWFKASVLFIRVHCRNIDVERFKVGETQTGQYRAKPEMEGVET